MFKTHFLINKELVVALILSFAAFVLLAANIIVLVSTVNDLYFSQPQSQKAQSIDANTINTAIEILNQ